MRLTGRTILVTGATAGIGRALALRLAAANTVIACGRRADRLEPLAGEATGIVPRVADLGDASGRDELARWVTAEHPEVDTLVNNAGVQLATDLAGPVDLGAVRNEVETNLIAPLHLSALLTPHLSGRPGAAIVNVTSGLAFVPRVTVPVYCATKAAMHSLCLSQRHALAPLGIAVHEIAPPAVDTELGHQNRSDAGSSHGGMPIEDFVDAALAGLERDEAEIAVGQAARLRDGREALFEQMNAR